MSVPTPANINEYDVGMGLLLTARIDTRSSSFKYKLGVKEKEVPNGGNHAVECRQNVRTYVGSTLKHPPHSLHLQGSDLSAYTCL